MRSGIGDARLHPKHLCAADRFCLAEEISRNDGTVVGCVHRLDRAANVAEIHGYCAKHKSSSLELDDTIISHKTDNFRIFLSFDIHFLSKMRIGQETGTCLQLRPVADVLFVCWLVWSI